MGVDDAKGLILAFQILDEARQDDVLDDIRKISGVIGVTIIHGCACFMSASFRQEAVISKKTQVCVVPAISLLSQM